MKYIYLFFPLSFILFLVSCSIGSIYVYNYQPVLKISGDTTETSFFVQDLSPDGWYYGNGVDSFSIKILLSETKNVEAYLSDIEWDLVCETYGSIKEDRISFLKPLELKNSKSDTIIISLTVNENNAYWIDLSDGINDNVGKGVFIIKALYYDEFGKSYESLPFYLPIKVIKP